MAEARASGLGGRQQARQNARGGAEDPTRSRILATTAAMFAEHGIDAVSIRAIAEAASVNVAAVNYHFGSKDMLHIEVFREVARRSAERRLATLDRILGEAEASGRRPALDAILASFVDAYVNADAPRDGVLLAQLVLKHRVSPTAWTEAVVRDELDHLAARYFAAIAAAAPELSIEDVHWRYHMMAGAVVMTLSDNRAGRRIQRLSGDLCRTDEAEGMRAAILRFLGAAFSVGPGGG